MPLRPMSFRSTASMTALEVESARRDLMLDTVICFSAERTMCILVASHDSSTSANTGSSYAHPYAINMHLL